MVSSIAVGLLGTLFLYFFYSSIRIKWPNNYITLRSGADRAISRTPQRYFVFRGAPFALTSLAVSISAIRLDQSSMVGLLSLWTSHTALTNGRSLWASIRAGRAALNTITSNVITALFLLAIGFVVWRLQELASPVVPPLEEFVAALWTGLVAAVLAVYLQNVVSRESEELDHTSIERDLKRETQEQIDRYSYTHMVDSTLIRSIIYTEVLNRPRWVRRLERPLAFFGLARTLGVGQTQIGPLDPDERSIEVLASSFSNTTVPRTSHGSCIDAALCSIAERHNNGKRFLEGVVEIFNSIEEQRPGASILRTADDQPLILVSDVRRVGSSWALKGTCSDSITTAALHVVNDTSVVAFAPIDGRTVNGRRQWTASVSVLELNVGVAVDSSAGPSADGAAAIYLGSWSAS